MYKCAFSGCNAIVKEKPYLSTAHDLMYLCDKHWELMKPIINVSSFTDYPSLVKDFHKKYELPISETPTLASREEALNRVRLITEELSEYVEALAKNDIVEVSDALGDLLYVVFGACIVHGLPIDEIFEEIHRSNMSKTGHKDSAGKFVKESMEAPVLSTILLDKYRKVWADNG